MMLNMQKILYSLNNCIIRIIENGVAADLRKTIADHTWRNQDILNIPRRKMENYLSIIK